MEDITLVVLCAGESSRFKLPIKKQWLRIKDEPLWLNVTKRLSSYVNFNQIIVVSHKDELNYMKNFDNMFQYVAGGSTRQGSITNALKHIDTKYVMITDVARCCVPKKVIKTLIKHKAPKTTVVPVLKATDTIVYKTDTIDRNCVKMVQTPQLSCVKTLKKALNTKTEFTDESSAMKNIGAKIVYIDGSTKSTKLTFGTEMANITCLKKPSKDSFVGFGIDTHQFEESKPMVLGGVEFDVDYGMKAHSDGDVVIHSIIDALLGACGAGDIGEFFPDTDSKYKNVDSKELLKYIVKFVGKVGYKIINIDLTILAQQPKISPYKLQIKTTLAELLDIPQHKINIKATTSEKMGFIGRKEGITVHSVAMLKYYDWTKDEYINN